MHNPVRRHYALQAIRAVREPGIECWSNNPSAPRPLLGFFVYSQRASPGA
ncbi:MAG: hypothetical protein AAGC55_33310 [Myxococcota bacterium]